MKSAIYWINGNWPGRLAILARPCGGDWLEDEIAAWARAGLNVIVSLLKEDEAAELGLHREGELCRAAGLSFISFPIEDRSVPVSRQAALELTDKLDKLLQQGQHIGISLSPECGARHAGGRQRFDRPGIGAASRITSHQRGARLRSARDLTTVRVVAGA